ncbi:TIGR04211 family SH3 domain-containing protein [Martelella alba]|uniref:SH3 domain-containing protein n=1 Tax=Martelella alba TaxID=2590451 RepID=A0ABY2SII0_9HYPH|nr:TIGR04211 family SH3 domain-containing protein [Martelella alba]TKI04909.1 SH3 domain-containing protein [Martelella alba]
MYKLRHICFALWSLSFAASTHADEQRYISDDLSTYIHSGPGNQYRIVGTLNAGDEVTLLNVNNDTDYGQIRDARGRTAWIPLNQLSKDPSLRTQVPTLQQQVQNLTQKLSTIDADWKQRTADMQRKASESDSQLEQLRGENDALKSQLATAKSRTNALEIQLDDKQRAIIMQWFLYGGGVAGIGLLLGLLLPHILPRRKRDNRWMN